jgi:hypothetical protein
MSVGRPIAALAFLVVTSLFVACPVPPPVISEGEGAGEGEGEGEDDTDVATVLVQPAGGQFCTGFCAVEVGGTFALEAVALDVDNNPLEAGAPTWEVVETDLASVDDTGVVTGLVPGLVTVRATIEGVTGEGFVEVTPKRPARIEVTPDTLSLDDGATSALTIAVFDEDDQPLPDADVGFVMGDPAVATVDENGVVTGVGPGRTILSVVAALGVFDAVAITVTSSDPLPAALADVASVTAGVHHTCAVTSSGTGLCFGDNQFGQLGDGIRSDPLTPFPTPQPVSVPDGGTWTSLSAGQYVTCGLDDGGAAWCWGGALGVGGDVDVPTPVETDALFDEIALTGSHACGVTTTGEVLCWGDNFFGQLGDGTFTPTSTPVAVDSARRFSHVAVGAHASCAIDDDTEEALCWGNNEFAYLGDGTLTSSTTPVVVASDARFRAIDGGSNHMCALTTTNGVECWGAGDTGELGAGHVVALAAFPVVVVAP